MNLEQTAWGQFSSSKLSSFLILHTLLNNSKLPFPILKSLSLKLLYSDVMRIKGNDVYNALSAVFDLY